MNPPDPKDISFIVQGPIAGKPDDKPENRHTYRALQSIRRYFPGSTIILSTWKGADVQGLDYDQLIENDDPGVSVMGDFTPNCFRQIVSSLNGLKTSKTKYSIKTRPDIIFQNSQILHYFSEFSELPRNKRYEITQERILTLTTINPHRRLKLPYHASDWLFFGLTEDLIDMFDVPLILSTGLTRTNREGKICEVGTMFSCEQYILTKFLLKKGWGIHFKTMDDLSHDNIATYERYIANNSILLTAHRAGIDWLKFPGAAYAQRPAMSNTGMYTFNEYKALLNKYAGTHLLIIPNPFEMLVYTIVYNLRFYIEQKSPKLHDKIRRMINPKIHKKLDEIARRTAEPKSKE